MQQILRHIGGWFARRFPLLARRPDDGTAPVPVQIPPQTPENWRR